MKKVVLAIIVGMFFFSLPVYSDIDINKGSNQIVLYNFVTNKKETLEINPKEMTDQDTKKYLPDLPEVQELYHLYRSKQMIPLQALLFTYQDYLKIIKKKI